MNASTLARRDEVQVVWVQPSIPLGQSRLGSRGTFRRPHASLGAADTPFRSLRRSGEPLEAVRDRDIALPPLL